MPSFSGNLTGQNPLNALSEAIKGINDSVRDMRTEARKESAELRKMEKTAAKTGDSSGLQSQRLKTMRAQSRVEETLDTKRRFTTQRKDLAQEIRDRTRVLKAKSFTGKSAKSIAADKEIKSIQSLERATSNPLDAAYQYLLAGLLGSSGTVSGMLGGGIGYGLKIARNQGIKATRAVVSNFSRRGINSGLAAVGYKNVTIGKERASIGKSLKVLDKFNNSESFKNLKSIKYGSYLNFKTARAAAKGGKFISNALIGLGNARLGVMGGWIKIGLIGVAISTKMNRESLERQRARTKMMTVLAERNFKEALGAGASPEIAASLAISSAYEQSRIAELESMSGKGYMGWIRNDIGNGRASSAEIAQISAIAAKQNQIVNRARGLGLQSLVSGMSKTYENSKTFQDKLMLELMDKSIISAAGIKTANAFDGSTSAELVAMANWWHERTGLGENVELTRQRLLTDHKERVLDAELKKREYKNKRRKETPDLVLEDFEREMILKNSHESEMSRFFSQQIN